MNVKGQISNPTWYSKRPSLTLNHLDFIGHLGLVIWHLPKAICNISGITNTPDHGYRGPRHAGKDVPFQHYIKEPYTDSLSEEGSVSTLTGNA